MNPRARSIKFGRSILGKSFANIQTTVRPINVAQRLLLLLPESHLLLPPSTNLHECKVILGLEWRLKSSAAIVIIMLSLLMMMFEDATAYI